MRVLCVGVDYPPLSNGGYELQCAGAVEHLRAHGHTVRVLTSAREGAADSSTDRGGGVHRDFEPFPAVPVPVDEAEAERAERSAGEVFARHLADFRPDVISWWRLAELSMSLPARAREAGVPGVGMVCDPWPLEGPQRDPWCRHTGARPDFEAARWLFASRALRELVGGRGTVVSPGIELDAFGPVPPKSWSGRLLYAGRLSRLKGVDTAIAALASAPAGCTLDLVGEGPAAYRDELRDLAQAAGVADRVSLRPGAPPQAMAGVYAACDAVLFPVRWAEPWGLVPLEAMAVGRPVVATGTGGSAEYLRDGANALLVEPDDPEGLAAAVGRLARDAPLRARLRAGGRRTAGAYPAQRSHEAVRLALEAVCADA